YEAEQVSLGRHVALKVLPAQHLLDLRQLGRFQREAKAAARLHHTNIVPVYGVGEADGLHYYVMQFIQGQPLDGVLDELRRLRQASRGSPASGEACPVAADVPGSPEARRVAEALLTERFTAAGAARPGPTLPYYRSVALVGARVADALAHAHQQGTLHRDVKPSNLLLDARGNVWVTDFGLAKASDAGDLTAS